MKYHLSDIIDVEKISQLLNSYTEATGLVSALLDLDGNILSKSGWQRICTDFHRVNPDTAKNCKTSDTGLANQLSKGGEFNVYKCLNGLVDVAVPLKVKGFHVGNLFTGQFFIDEPDKQFFENQAEKYNFNKTSYLAALNDVPKLKIEDIKSKLNFLLHMTVIIAEIGVAKVIEIESKNELEKSGIKYRNLFENLNEAFALHEIITNEKNEPVDYTYLEVNSAFKKITGIKGEIIGKSIKEILPGTENDPADWIGTFGKVALTGKKASFEQYSSVLNKWYYVHAFCPQKGQFAVTFTDITDRKLAETEILNSENKFRKLFENAFVGTVFNKLVRDKTGKAIDFLHLDANIATRKHLNASPEQIIGTLASELVSPDQAEFMTRLNEKVVNTGIPYHIEKYFEAFDKTIELSAFHLEGDIFVSTFIDISNRKKSEQLLKESEEYHKALFSQTNIGLALTTMEGQLADVNEAFANIIGYSVQEALKLTYWELTPQKYKEQEQSQIENLEKYGSYGPYEKEYIHKDGRHIPVRLQGRIIEQKGVKYIWSSVENITDYVNAQNKLRSSETKYRAIVEQSLTGIYIFSKEKFVYVNQRFCEIFGYSEREILDNLKPTDVVEKPEREKAQKNIEDRLSGAVDSVHYFARGKRKDKKELWIEIHGTHVELDGEQVITGTVLDVTQKYKDDILIEESEQKFRSLFEQAAVGVAIIDSSTGKYQSVNKKQCDIIGYSEEELLSSDFMQLTHPDDLSEDLKNMAKLKRGDIDNFMMEKRYLHKNGSTVWVNLSVARLWLKGQNPNLHAALCEDITEKKKVEFALKESAANLQKQNEELLYLMSMGSWVKSDFKEAIQNLTEICSRIIQSGRVSVWWYNADYSEIECFDIFDKETKKHSSGEKLKSKDFPKYRKEHVAGRLIDAIDVLSDPRTKEIPKDYYLRHNIKSLLDVPVWIGDEVGGLLSFEETGQQRKWTKEDERLVTSIATMVSFAHEINERKNAEIEVNKLNRELEQKVKARTAQLESINNQLQAFTYSVSHDLKAPLRGINGYSKLLQEMYSSSLNDEAKKFIGNIRSGTDQMNQLIDDLLTYSRLERSRIKKAKVDVRNIINSTLSSYSKEIEERNIKVTIEGNCKEIIVDNDSFNIVIRNLIENALKFTTDTKTPSVQIQISETKARFMLSVKDNGVGFDMKFHDKIFEIFQRLHRSEDYPGTGIGLALVYKAMEKMHGKIWAKSKLSEGAQFFIELPKTYTNE